MEDLNLTALEQQLQSKKDALQGKLIALQELQASLLHPVRPCYTRTADSLSSVCFHIIIPIIVWLLAPNTHLVACACKPQLHFSGSHCCVHAAHSVLADPIADLQP